MLGFVVSEPTQGSNNAEAYAATLQHFISMGALGKGDYLVYDGAKIHVAEEIQDQLEALEAVGINLIRLPTYSPELNPCELVFGRAKRYLRDHRGRQSFLTEMASGFSKVTNDMMRAFYRKCIIDAVFGRFSNGEADLDI